MLSSLSLLALLLAATDSVRAAVRTYNFDMTYVDNISADGLKGHERRVIGVNGTWPPPVIEVDYQDTLVINVKNSLGMISGVHSHGFYQNGTVWMDGSVGVTQCGIPPGASYTYQYDIQQNGTYWYHSHFMGQYADGFRAPLIVKSPQEAYKYDDEYTVVVSDWYFREYPDIYKDFMNEYNPTGMEPSPDSNTLLVAKGTQYIDAKSMTFVPGKTYRIRLINTSAFAMFAIGISGHDMEIIEVDGVDVERQKVDGHFIMTVAQRYSILVTARNDTSSNWYLYADMDTSVFSPMRDTLNPNITVPIVYDSSKSFPTNRTWGDTFDDITLVPLIQQASAPADTTVNLSGTMAVMTDGLPHAQFNNATYVMPKVPTLVTAMTTGAFAMSPQVYGKQTNAFVLPHLHMIQVILQNLDTGAHPFHLHGHEFQVLNRSESLFDPSTPIRELPNPVRRDVVLVPAGGSVILRFRADNPGVWLFHCHIQWHMDQGLVAVFVEAPDQLQKLQASPQLAQTCAAQGVPTSGNVIGKLGLDLDGEPDGPFMLPDGFTSKGWGALAATVICAIGGLAVVVWFGAPYH